MSRPAIVKANELTSEDSWKLPVAAFLTQLAAAPAGLTGAEVQSRIAMN